MEISTGLGMFVVVAAMGASIMIDGGSPSSLFNVSAFVMVLGGSLGATLIAYPLATVKSLPSLMAQSFKSSKADPQAAINQFVTLADQARREGLLSLEEEASKVEDSLIKKGLMLIVDGVDPAVVRDVLEIDNEMSSRRHSIGIAMLETLGGLGPSMGMVGTVMGLVGVLRNLSDPSTLGPSIAIAFLTTLYGVLLANVFWNPMASKLKQKDKTETLTREVIVEGILAIQAGENPRIVREKLESFLLPRLRGQEGADGGA
ncbi:MAG TPA: motility protein A [Anaerolineae bacterium]|nr:motility protein A [Anaerolineae bacterium]MCB0224108.1 motility protein A [Anaerolineae bacterium]HRV90558.1 motility protein A [Anaerolineae bacterium]